MITMTDDCIDFEFEDGWVERGSTRKKSAEPKPIFLKRAFPLVDREIAPRYMVSCVICGKCRHGVQHGAIIIKRCDVDGARIRAGLKFCDNFQLSDSVSVIIPEADRVVGVGGWVDDVRLIKMSLSDIPLTMRGEGEWWRRKTPWEELEEKEKEEAKVKAEKEEPFECCLSAEYLK